VQRNRTFSRVCGGTFMDEVDDDTWREKMALELLSVKRS
jgi:hypothetical protein